MIALAVLTFYPLSGFLGHNEQDRILLAINSYISDREAKLPFEVINPSDDWDRVCFVTPYSFHPFLTPYEKIQNIYGADFPGYRWQLPNTQDGVFAMGFSFVKGRELTKFVAVNSHAFELSIVHGVIAKPNYFSIGGQNIYVADLRFSFLDDRRCFDRKQSGMSLEKNKTLTIGDII